MRVVLPVALLFIGAMWLWAILKGPAYWKRMSGLASKEVKEVRRMSPEAVRAYLNGEEPGARDGEPGSP